MKMLTVLLVSFILPTQLHAWYDSNATDSAPNWKFRVPINIPATATQNSTIKLDVDFNSLLSSLGVSGVLDIASPRIVRADDTTLASSQEFTDTLYNSATDAANDSKGEIKFIYDDNGANTYYLYFDITANGTKPANPSPTINGNFEHSAAGTTPAEWTLAIAPAGVTNQNNEVHDTAAGATYSNTTVSCSDGSINSIDDAPKTGRRWHLAGYRDQCEAGSLAEQIMLRKTISVPASSPDNLSFYFQLQAFDDINYDYFRVRVNGVDIDHTTLGVSSTSLSVVTTKIGRMSGYGGGGLVDSGWQQATLNLASYAGTNITFELAMVFAGDNVYRSWVKLDDVEWSVKSASLGAPQQMGPSISLKKTSVVISDPFGSASPKRVPGAVVEYTITATNSGTGSADNNTIVIVDSIPSNTKYVVDSITFIPAAPIDSGLTANSSNYTYSLDGGTTFGSTQTTSVTQIKIAPSGEFLSSSGSGTPSFAVKFKVIVD